MTNYNKIEFDEDIVDMQYDTEQTYNLFHTILLNA